MIFKYLGSIIEINKALFDLKYPNYSDSHKDNLILIKIFQNIYSNYKNFLEKLEKAIFNWEFLIN